MAWLILLAAGIFEIIMALALKFSNGWTSLWPSVVGIAACLASIFLLTLSFKTLPVGTAYAIWTGIGSVGIVLLGIVFFGESANLLRLLCIGLIIAGMAGLKLIEAS